MLLLVLLSVAPCAFGQGVVPVAGAPASGASPRGQAPAAAVRPAAQRTREPAPSGVGAARRPAAPVAAPDQGAGASSEPPAAGPAGRTPAVSARAQREAEHPYYWIRRNGELAYQRYAARVAQARAEGLPPPPTRAATGRPALPATAFDPERLPPTAAGAGTAGTVVSTQPGATAR